MWTIRLWLGWCAIIFIFTPTSPIPRFLMIRKASWPPLRIFLIYKGPIVRSIATKDRPENGFNVKIIFAKLMVSWKTSSFFKTYESKTGSIISRILFAIQFNTHNIAYSRNLWCKLKPKQKQTLINRALKYTNPEQTIYNHNLLFTKSNKLKIINTMCLPEPLGEYCFLNHEGPWLGDGPSSSSSSFQLGRQEKGKHMNFRCNILQPTKSGNKAHMGSI